MDSEALTVMLSKDREEWEALVAVLEAHPEESLHDPAAPAWTSRDVYTHMARWINHSTDHLEAELAGRTLPPLAGTDDEINARWQEEDSGLSLAEARERAQRAFERRLRAIEAVPAERWDARLAEIAGADGHEHFAGHRKAIVVGGGG
jgi:hypothetical protein